MISNFDIITAIVLIFLSELLFFNKHMHKTFMIRKSLAIRIHPGLGKRNMGVLKSLGILHKIDNADPMLLYLDQTPAKYLHLSCIFSPGHGACSDILSHS